MGRLARGAKGINLGDFSILFGRGKIMALPEGGPDHYTLQLQTRSEIIDLHQTSVATGRHDTLFAMPSDRIPAVLGEMRRHVGGFLAAVPPAAL